MPALKAAELAFTCLEYIGEYSLTPVEYEDDAATGLMRALVRAQNEALDELFELNPALFKREVGLTVPAPVTGTVGVTANSVEVNATSISGTMAGNAIRIEGQTEWNVIRLDTAVRKLVFPYTGTTGTKTATMYGDALLLPSTFSRPLGPVWLADIRELIPLNGRHDYIGYDPNQDLNTDWGRYPFGAARLPQGRQIGQPEAFLVDNHTPESGIGTDLRILLTPVPDRQYSLRFDAGVRPLAVTAEEIGDDDENLPERYFPLPAGLDHRFLLPLVLYYWSRSAFFKDAEKRKRIEEDRDALLPQIEAWKVQPQTGGHLVTTGYRRPRR